MRTRKFVREGGFPMREWREYYAMKSVFVEAPAQKILLFDNAFIPSVKCVLTGFKVDTEIPYPDRGELWLQVSISGRKYSYPVSAFDRSLVDVRIERNDDVPDDLVVCSNLSRLTIPLLKQQDEHVVVTLEATDKLKSSGSVTVMLYGVQELSIHG